jgi:hypothetical protein
VNKISGIYRAGLLAGTMLLATGAAALANGSASAAVPAASPAPDGICTGNSCLNAWNGGPFVNAYTGGTANSNDEFIIVESGANVEIQFLGSGSWHGECVGDAYNESTDARTSLDSCGADGSGAGWGTQFTEVSCPGGQAFKNIHWGGYLAPASGANGAAFYLNSSEACFA